MQSHDTPAARPEATGRRTFLKWATNGLAAAFAATLGAPAIMYFLDPRNRPAPPGVFKPVARLSELTEGVPFEAVIRQDTVDAWTLRPAEIVGRVWLIKQKDGSVKALNVTCPHLGCPVNFESGKFVCPCHNGTFTIDGERTDPGAGRTNPALRDMDDLRVKVVDDADNPKDKVVQVEYLNFFSNIPEKTVRS